MGDKKKILFTFIVLPVVLIVGLVVSLFMNKGTDDEEAQQSSELSKSEQIDQMLLEEYRKSQSTREFVEYTTEAPNSGEVTGAVTNTEEIVDDMIDFSGVDSLAGNIGGDITDDEEAIIAAAERDSWESTSKLVLNNGIEIVTSVNQVDTSGGTEFGLTDAELSAAHPLFLQYDSRWADHPYGSSTMAHCACGPTSFSMVITALTGITNASPPVVATYSMSHGYYVYGAGTAHTLFTQEASTFGLYCTPISITEEDMKAHLDNGEMLILAMHAGHFTSGGHFIVIYGYDASGFMVNDPGSLERSMVYWPFSIVGSEADNIYALGSLGIY